MPKDLRPRNDPGKFMEGFLRGSVGLYVDHKTFDLGQNLDEALEELVQKLVEDGGSTMELRNLADIIKSNLEAYIEKLDREITLAAKDLPVRSDNPVEVAASSCTAITLANAVQNRGLAGAAQFITNADPAPSLWARAAQLAWASGLVGPATYAERDAETIIQAVGRASPVRTMSPRGRSR